MATRIFLEENQHYQFDFSAAKWATDRLHKKYTMIQNVLPDVDFLVETDECYLLVEYKNSKIPNAAKPDAFNPMNDDKHDNKIALKFYGGLLYLLSHRKRKPYRYVYVLESPKVAGQTERLFIRNKIRGKLPFVLQNDPELKGHKWIESFEVLSIDEWNHTYKDFPIQPVTQPANQPANPPSNP